MHDRLLPIEHQTTCAVSPVKHLSLKYLTLKNKHSFEKKIHLRTYFIDTLYSNYFGKGYFLHDFRSKKSVYRRKFDFTSRFKFYNFFLNFCSKPFKIWITIEKNHFWRKKIMYWQIFFHENIYFPINSHQKGEIDHRQKCL